MSDIHEIDAKLNFLQGGQAYGDARQTPDCIETHMSWVFLVGQLVYKLKKPVRFPYLDFTTLQAREFFCREEIRLNARLAPNVYLGLLALQWRGGYFRLVPEAQLDAHCETLDWLILMRRLPDAQMLHQKICQASVGREDIAALTEVLVRFYRAAKPVHVSADDYMMRFQSSLVSTREVLLRPQFHLDNAALAIDQLDKALTQGAVLLRERASRNKLVEGHGDLRPDHVCLSRPPVVIDCIEFNPQLRELDPFDEIAYLGLECSMAGAAWIGPQVVKSCAIALGDDCPAALLQLYTANRALMRARFTMAHLLDPHPRTPERWAPLAQQYIGRALDALDGFSTAMLHG
jgi:aminoglycoside phosphotransferase family enzyme